MMGIFSIRRVFRTHVLALSARRPLARRLDNIFVFLLDPDLNFLMCPRLPNKKIAELYLFSKTAGMAMTGLIVV